MMASAANTLRVIAALGSYHGGPPDFEAHGLGGGNDLRGYEKQEFTGDAFWRLSLEYQRPIFGEPSLRGLLILDAGHVYDDLDDINLNRMKVDVGLGLRWRLQTFVNLTIELGYAMALDRSSPEPFFGKL